jgi:tRNA 2-thiouridine synthesizing protein A
LVYKVVPTHFANDILPHNNSPVMSNTRPAAAEPSQTLDITGEVCPMTFVRTRLALDRLAPGELLLVLLKGEEPRRNVPDSAAGQGHQVVSREVGPDGVMRLLLRRG